MKTIILTVLSMVVLIGAGSIGMVAAANPPEKPCAGVVIFAVEKYQDWQWNGRAYPEDMLFTAALAGQDTLKLFAQLGTEPTGGFGIGIEKAVLEGDILTVSIHTKSPSPSQMVTMAFTNPKDEVTIDLKGVWLSPELEVRWIDQTGKLLFSTQLNAPSQLQK